ncbi:MAG: pyridoxal phosphate-dependent aminotransferase [Lachnospiraceae bacterium]
MKRLSNITALQPTGMRKMFDLAATMDNVISFALGEPNFDTPQNVIAAAKDALDRGETHYNANAGILPLRNSIAKKMKENEHLDYDPLTEIQVTVGGMEALYLTLMVLLDTDDEVILTDPCYTNYLGQIVMNKGVPVPIPVYEENGFNYTEESLRNAITDKTKVIVLNSPCNPTGGVATRETQEMVAKIAIEHDLYVIYDEVYKYLVYDGLEFFNIASIPGMKERTIIIDSVSKSYAMTGWRVGFALGPADIIGHMPKLQENLLSCVNTPSQWAAVEALEGPQDACAYMNKQYLQRRNLICEGINKIDKLSCTIPKGAFYVFMNIKETGLTSDEFALRLLKEAKVVLSAGSGFGVSGEGYVRIAYATSTENIIEGLKRIEKFVSTL